jgi:hypothetical protein
MGSDSGSEPCAASEAVCSRGAPQLPVPTPAFELPGPAGVEAARLLARVVCGFYGASPALVSSAAKFQRAVRVRTALCQLAVGQLGWSSREIAHRFCLTPASVTRALERRIDAPDWRQLCERLTEALGSLEQPGS